MSTNKNMPQMPNPIKQTSDEVASAQTSISPTLGASAEANAPSLDMPASASPKIEDPKDEQKQPDTDALKEFEAKFGMTIEEALQRKNFTPEEPVSLKPKMQSPDTNISNHVNVPKRPEGGFEVVATMNGFHNQNRYKRGDLFTIDSWEEIGTWMQMIDPDLEKKRKAALSHKKANY